MSTAATGAYHVQKVTSKYDARNAFNAVERRKILKAAEEIWEEAASFYDLY